MPGDKKKKNYNSRDPRTMAEIQKENINSIPNSQWKNAIPVYLPNDVVVKKGKAVKVPAPKPNEYSPGSSETLDNLSSNVFSYFLGVKNDGLIPSPYRPTNAKDPKSKYYTYKNIKNDIKEDLIGDSYNERIANAEKVYASGNPNYNPIVISKNRSFDDYYNYLSNSKRKVKMSGNSINLGHYNLSAGEDERGRYISAYDKYDWNLLEGAGFNGNSWETYDRIYDDEWDKIQKPTKKEDGGAVGDPIKKSKGNTSTSVPITLYGPTDTVKKGNKTVKVKRPSIIGSLPVQPSINNPIEFLNSYYNSDEFKRKSGSFYDANMSYYKAGDRSYDVEYVDSSNEGSNAVPATKLVTSDMFGKGRGKDPSIILDRSQAKRRGMNLENDILPHEYSHTTRELSADDEAKFIEKNRDFLVKDFYRRYLEDINTTPTEHNFSRWSQSVLNHEQLPSENYSDMNTLRWILYKNNIYDARKGPLTKEQLQKAIEDPNIKDNFMFKRLLKSFSIDDIVELNNTIAYNNQKNNTPMARNGLSMKRKNYMSFDPGGNPSPQEKYYQSSARLSHYKNILNDKLKAKNPEAFSNYFKGLVDLRRSGKTNEADKYVQSTAYNEYLTPQEVKSTLGDNDYNDYLSSIREVNAYDVAQGKQPLYGNVEGETNLNALNYGRRFASLQITPSLSVFNKASGKNYKRNYTYNPVTRQVDVKEEGDVSLRPNYVSSITPTNEVVNNMDDGGVLAFKVPQIPIHTEMMEGPLDGLEKDGIDYYAKSGIHIKPENRGKFNALKKRTGKTTEELTHSKNPLTRKRAIFAQNAKKWNKGKKKDDGGIIEDTYLNPLNYDPTLDYYEEYANNPNLMLDEEAEFGTSLPDPTKPKIDGSITNPNNVGGYLWDPMSQAVPTPFEQNNSGVIDTRTNQQFFTVDPNQQGPQFNGDLNQDSNQQNNPLFRIGEEDIQNGLLGLAYATGNLNRPRSNRMPLLTSYNPYAQGTGSQAIMKHGGRFKANSGVNINSGGSMSQISNPDESNPVFKFNGNSHEQGGIKIDYNGNPVEVEGGETAYMDNGGNFNVFGNMRVPGTKMNFDTMGEKLAKEEQKYNKGKYKGADIVNEADLESKNLYERYRFNAGKVMLESNEQAERNIGERKENLVALQNAMLLTANTFGEDPKKMFNGKAKNGASFGAYDPYKRVPYDAAKPMPKDPYKPNFPIAKFDNGGRTNNYTGSNKSSDFMQPLFTQQSLNSEASFVDPMPITLDNGGGIKDKFAKLKQQTEAALAKKYPGKKITVVPSYDRDISTQRGLMASKKSKTPVSLHNLGAAGDYNIYVDGKLVQDPQVYKDTLWKEANNLGLHSLGDWDPAHISAVKEGKGTAFSTLLSANPEIRDTDQYKNTVSYLKDLIDKKQATNREISAYNQLTGSKIAIPKGRGYIDNTRVLDTSIPSGQVAFGETYINQNLTDLPNIEQLQETNIPNISTNIEANVPNTNSSTINNSIPDFKKPVPGKSRDIRNPLSIDQYFPEAYVLATNREQPVQAQYYTPELFQPYEVSFQDLRNQNQADFNATTRQLVNAGRYDLLSTVAADKYRANESITAGQEFRTNQGIANDVYNKNIGLLNQAELTNLQIADLQADRQAQAYANTQDRTIDAITSLSAKSAQNKLETKTANLYSQMMKNFSYNEKNGKIEFNPDSITGPVITNPNGTTTEYIDPNKKIIDYEYDSKGRRTRKVETEPQYKVQKARWRLFG